MTVRADRLRARTATMRIELARYLPAFVLAGYGTFILSLYLRNDLTLYINPAYVGPTTLAAVILLLLAAVKVYRPVSDACCDEGATCGSESCGCAGSPRRIWPYFGLCIPLFLAALLPPQSLAAFSARQRGPQIAGITSIHSGTAARHVSLSVDTGSFGIQDWAGALSADPSPRNYLGKAVNLTGMILHDPASMPPGYVMVMRYQITCCIADARPEGLIVRDVSHGSLKDSQWVRLIGTMGGIRYQGADVTVVIPRSLRPTKAGNPYMY